MGSVRASSGGNTKQYLIDLQGVLDEQFVNLEVANTPHYIYDPLHYVLDNGGKRLRPVLVGLASRLTEPESERAFPAAMAVQLFHDFTLVHDDIMDNSDERRGKPSVYKKFDLSKAILSGDLLLCLAYSNVARLDDVHVRSRVFDVFNQMAVKVCEGQALDAELALASEVDLQGYLQMIDGKTAALLEACLEIGGIIGGLNDSEIASLRSIGNSLGRAFQIQDDLLDIVADSASWGKPVGGDLVEGKRTFPVLKGYELAPRAEKAWFESYFESRGIEFDDVENAREFLESLGVFAATRKEVENYSELALSELGNLPEGIARDALRSIVDRLNTRAF